MLFTHWGTVNLVVMKHKFLSLMDITFLCRNQINSVISCGSKRKIKIDNGAQVFRWMTIGGFSNMVTAD